LSADSSLTVTVRSTRDAKEIEAAMDLRIRVFCGEQGVSEEEERDELDDEATQIVALDDSGVIATCRLRYLEGGTCKLERMAVDRERRERGVGGRLLAGAEAEAREHGSSEMLLHAQRRAESFYASSGYVAEGDTFMEAEIEHVRMRKAL
jgi:predicted GNAT family N-acyltransferase